MNEELDLLTLPPIYWEDLYQERELLKLQGIVPSMQIIMKKHSLSREVLFADSLPDDAFPVFSQPLPDVEIIQQIIDWSISQSQQIQELIYAFLELPSDEGLEELLEKLQIQGVILAPVEELKPIPFSKLVIRLLEARPHSLDELYEFARLTLINRRPESTVRQLLRRYLREGKVQVENDIYSLTQ